MLVMATASLRQSIFPPAQQGRGAADCGQRGEAAGAVAEGMTPSTMSGSLISDLSNVTGGGPKIFSIQAPDRPSAEACMITHIWYLGLSSWIIEWRITRFS
jgi:hypothetical protein